MPDNSVDFSGYPQPEWNGPDSVEVALNLVIQAHDEESSSSAYNKLLYAVGNNHAGTYYPVALAVMPSLEAIVRGGKPWPQRTVLEALIDLFSSFEPEPGYDTFHGVSLAEALREHITTFKPCLASLAAGSDITAKSAQDLQKCLDEGKV